MRTFLLAGVLLVGLGSPAFAFSCPKDMAEIDAMLERQPAVSEQTLAEVKRLRAEGEELHRAGRHAESVEALHRAKALLEGGRG